MKFHAPTKSIVIPVETLIRVSECLAHTIKHIRQSHDLDLKGYKHAGPMTHPQFAEQEVLNVAEALGIDLGARRYGDLDVTEA